MLPPANRCAANRCAAHLSVAAFVLVGGTGGSPSQLVPKPTEPVEIAESVDAAWDPVIDNFPEKFVPLRTLEKASGLVVSEQLWLSQEVVYWADCGRNGFGEHLVPTFASYNVRFKGDTTRSTARVTAIFTRLQDKCHINCVSRGNYERTFVSNLQFRLSAGRERLPQLIRGK